MLSMGPIFDKQVKLWGIFPKKTFDHLENKGSLLYEISEAGDLWKNGFQGERTI